MANKKNYLLLVLKGIGMGAADVIPGVSGGTIAFITGIYEELLCSIRSFNVTALRKLLKLDLKGFWQHINGAFLLAVLTGVGIAVFSLAKVMKYLLETHPIFIWSFFFGLIIASVWLVSKEIEKWDTGTIISLVVGTVGAYFITVLSPASTPNDWWFIMLCGAIAICAMILPGISGSFILLLLGKYAYVIDAVSTFDIKIMAVFSVGAIVGLISFSHLLSWLLCKFHGLTVALLTGFMLGSLNKIWPWKKTLEYFTNSHGEQQPLVEQNILPQTFTKLHNGEPALLGWAIAFAVFGFMLIWSIEKIAALMNKSRD